MSRTTRSRSVFARASLTLTRLINTSLFARAVHCYPKENESVERGLFAYFRRWFGFGSASALRFKMRASAQLYSSASQTLYSKAIRFLLTSRLRSLGTFCFLFGFINCATYFARRLTAPAGSGNAPTLIFGVLLVLASLPLFSARSTISSALWHSRAAGWFLDKVAGFREDELPSGSVHSGEICAVTAALIAGAISLITGPFFFCLAVFCLISVCLSLYKPEYGLTITLFLFPFLNAETISALCLFLLFCFLIKALCGKRAIKSDLCDLLFFFTLLYFMLSGIFPAVSAASGWFEFCAPGLLYFLISRLGKSRELIRRFMLSFSYGVALGAALHLFFTLVPLPAFLELGVVARTLSGHSGPMLLCAAACLLCALTITAKTSDRKLFCFFLFALTIADLWLFSSLSAYLALGAALCAELILYKRSFLFFFLAVLGAAAIALPLIPGEQTAFLREAFLNRSPSVLAASALPLNAYLCGLGVFDTGTLLSFSALSTAGENLTLTTQILLSVGLVGLFLLVLFLLGITQKAFHVYLSLAREKKRLFVTAPLCSLLALLLLGVAQNIGADPRWFALLCLLCAFSKASGDALYPSVIQNESGR